MSDAQQRIDDLVKTNDLVLFMKGNASFPMCGFLGPRDPDPQGRSASTPRRSRPSTCSRTTASARASRNTATGPRIPQLYVEGRIRGRLGHHDGDVRVRASCSRC